MRRPFALPRRRALRAGFLEDIWSELKKVTWPNREVTWRLTTMVVAISVAIGLILGLVDLGFTEIVDRVLVRR